MNWRFNGLISCHELSVDGEVMARIYCSEKPKRKRPFRARTLISAFCFGEQRLSRLARQGKEWVSNRRDFASDAERDVYLARRKADVGRFVAARVKEQA